MISLDAGITLSPAATALAAGSDCLDNCDRQFYCSQCFVLYFGLCALGTALGGVLVAENMTLQPNSDVIVLKHLRGDSLRIGCGNSRPRSMF